jgi:hypothetical protein
MTYFMIISHEESMINPAEESKLAFIMDLKRALFCEIILLYIAE